MDLRCTTRRLALAAAVVTLVCGPAFALDDGRPARLGWHMYAGLTSVPEITVRHADGAVTHVPVHDVVARLRPELDYGPAVTRHLCASLPGALTVTVEVDGEGEGRPCTSS